MSGEIFSVISGFFREHRDCLAAMGAACATYLAIRAICSIWHGLKVYVLSPILGLSVDITSFGSWAG